NGEDAESDRSVNQALAWLLLQGDGERLCSASQSGEPDAFKERKSLFRVIRPAGWLVIVTRRHNNNNGAASMTTAKPFWSRARLPRGISLASTRSAPAFALRFNIGELEAQFGSSLSVGASWATSKPNQDLIGANNGGRGLSQ